MKKLLVPMLAVLAASSFAGPVPKEWTDRYEGMLKLIRAKDSAAFFAFYASDFTLVDPAGKSASLADFKKMVTSMFANAVSIKNSIKLIWVKAKGDTAEVKFDFRMAITNKDKSVTRLHEIGVDYWKRTGGKWLETKTVDSVFKMDTKKSK